MCFVFVLLIMFPGEECKHYSEERRGVIAQWDYGNSIIKDGKRVKIKRKLARDWHVLGRTESKEMRRHIINERINRHTCFLVCNNIMLTISLFRTMLNHFEERTQRRLASQNSINQINGWLCTFQRFAVFVIFISSSEMTRNSLQTHTSK
jgi:hypothetical protein